MTSHGNEKWAPIAATRVEGGKSLDTRVEEIFDAAVARVEAREQYEAGGEAGRVTPALVLGPQRYPPLPPIDYAALPLTIDPDYGQVAKMIDERDRRDGFDGRPQGPGRL